MLIELAILDACAARYLGGNAEAHGFLIATLVKVNRNSKLLTAYGTLYRALGRLEKAGLLTSRWEDMDSLAGESRPRRRLYSITGAGLEALAAGRSADKGLADVKRIMPVPEGESP